MTHHHHHPSFIIMHHPSLFLIIHHASSIIFIIIHHASSIIIHHHSSCTIHHYPSAAWWPPARGGRRIFEKCRILPFVRTYDLHRGKNMRRITEIGWRGLSRRSGVQAQTGKKPTASKHSANAADRYFWKRKRLLLN